jgi:hypothetical protein
LLDLIEKSPSASGTATVSNFNPRRLRSIDLDQARGRVRFFGS